MNGDDDKGQCGDEDEGNKHEKESNGDEEEGNRNEEEGNRDEEEGRDVDDDGAEGEAKQTPRCTDQRKEGKGFTYTSIYKS